MSTETVKAFKFRNLEKKGWPIMKLADAVAKRWATKEDGQPTKIYFHRLKQAQAEKRGETIPRRTRKEAPEQQHAGLESPFDLRRRSGYKTIWQVLAESANEVVPWDVLQKEVNKRLLENVDGTDKTNWYQDNFVDPVDKVDKKTQEVISREPCEYDTRYNAIVIARAPYNGILPDGTVKERSIEGLKQRVIISDAGATLMTEVTEPRQFKQRGRRPQQPVKHDVVEDTDKSESIEAPEVEVALDPDELVEEAIS